MATETSLKTVEFDILPSTSSYAGIGEYSHSGYNIKLSSKLTRTGKNYYDSLKEIPKDSRISLASEDLAIQLGLERAGKDPRKAKEFDDLFARNNNGWYAWQWTLTGLRVPKDYRADKHEKDTQGRIHYLRIVLIGDEEVGEIPVPEGNGKAVMEWDEVFGIPRVTSDKEGDMKYDNHTTHFYFDQSPGKDKKSGHCDVAVARRSSWPRAGHGRCLDVDASYERWYASSDDSFRQVHGSLPAMHKEQGCNQ